MEEVSEVVAPDNPWYMAHSLIHAFNQRRREVVEPGTECIIDESMGMWKPFIENTPEGIPSLRKIARKPQGIGIEYKNLADAETGIDCNGKEGLL